MPKSHYSFLFTISDNSCTCKRQADILKDEKRIRTDSNQIYTGFIWTGNNCCEPNKLDRKTKAERIANKEEIK